MERLVAARQQELLEESHHIRTPLQHAAGFRLEAHVDQSPRLVLQAFEVLGDGGQVRRAAGQFVRRGFRMSPLERQRRNAALHARRQQLMLDGGEVPAYSPVGPARTTSGGTRDA